jgi:WhiB family redox-sensing transcriptional regulator
MDIEWMSRGTCKEAPWGLFFPREGTGVIAAKKICATCPVRQECLDYALEHHIDHGVWGGCSERERARTLRRRRTGRPVGVG